MRTAKRFDCIELKDQIQAKLAAEYRGLRDEEIRERTRQKLATSDSPVAWLWRSLSQHADDPGK